MSFCTRTLNVRYARQKLQIDLDERPDDTVRWRPSRALQCSAEVGFKCRSHMPLLKHGKRGEEVHHGCADEVQESFEGTSSEISVCPNIQEQGLDRADRLHRRANS